MKLRLIATALFAVGVFAQPGPPQGAPNAAPTPPTPAALKTALGLSDSQVTSLTQLQTQKRNQIQPIAQQIDDKQEAIHTALAKDNPDVNAIAALLVQVAALQKQIKSIDSGYTTQAAAILTADQKTKLNDLAKAQALEDAVHQAEGLNLLTPSDPPAGAGPGRNGAGGPGGPGPMSRFRGRGPAGMMNSFRPI